MADKARLIGRGDQLAFFEARLDDALRRDGSTTLLRGDPGIGKTRLLRAWTEAARARGFKVGATANYPFAKDAYATIAETCRVLAQGEPRAQPRDAADRALFGRFLQLFAPVASTGDTPWQKRRLFVIVREFLDRVSSYAPILMTIDDVQWIDPESRELVEYLAANLGGLRVVVALAVRSEAMIALPSAYVVSIGPLGAAETRELIFRTIPRGRSLPQRSIEEICRRSEGNPLFAADLVRDALDRSPTRTLPSSVQQSVAARLSTLPPRSVAILEIAAALGPTIALDLLRTLCSLAPKQEVSLFRAARTLGLTADVRGSTEPPRFRHELIREAIYERLTSVERRELHERIATRLETDTASASPGVLAWHWEGAGRAARAAAYAEQAGDLAARQGAFASARDHLEAALRSGTLDADALARVREKLGHAHDVLGSAQEAYDRFAQVAEHCAATGDRQGLARLSLRLANAAHRLADAKATLRHCHRAIDAALPHDPERFAAEVLLAMFHASRAELGEAQAHLASADAFEGIRDPAYVVRRHVAAAAIANLLGVSEESQRSALAAVEAAEQYGDPAIIANCWTLLADFARQQANYSLAQAALDHAIDVADSYALAYTSAYARLTAADMAFLRGDVPRAHAVLRFACALQVESAFVRFYAAAIGIPIALAVEDDALVERLSDDGLLDTMLQMGSSQNAAALAAAHAELRFARGDGPGAAALIHSTLPRLRNATYVYEALLKFARFGTPSDARAAAALFGPDASTDPVARVHELLTHAIALTSVAEAGTRRSLLAEARALAVRLGLPALEALADELGGERAAAIVRYREIGATRDARRLSDDGERRGTRASQTLTAREREIARLVADGLSNRAIAEQLALSNRTVEHHVASVFAKLDLRSRAELAALIARRATAASPAASPTPHTH